MESVSASELEKDFARWHHRAVGEPVQITKDGEESAYLVSAEMFRQLWSCYRRAVRVENLTEEEMELIRNAEIPPEHRYELKEIPD